MMMSPRGCIIRSIIQHDIHFKISRTFYDWRSRFDTIFALATTIQPLKGSPLAVIRASGPKTVNALQVITKLEPIRVTACELDIKTSNTVNQQQAVNCLLPRAAKLVKIFEPSTDELIDIGIVLWFPRPNSYTGEDSLEFHVHGSQAIVKKLTAILGNIDGFRPAEPGEFTRRALENGKMTLIQAESLPELISAQTDEQRKLALRGLSGSTKNRYDKWIANLVHILAHLEASIDFGEDELIGEQKVVRQCAFDLIQLSEEISKFMIVMGKCRELIRSGARVSILGRPNAGKSTLMNMLCRQEKSIVSNLKGTTRDIIEHSIELNGHTIILCDTAGLRKSNLVLNKDFLNKDVEDDGHANIEREGIRRALDIAAKSDLIIYMVEADQMTSDQFMMNLIEELDILRQKIQGKSLHIVINKIDLNPTIDQFDCRGLEKSLVKRLSTSRVRLTKLSCKTCFNFNELLEQIASSLNEMQPKLDDRSILEQSEYINERHSALLSSTLRHLERASKLEMKNIDEMAQHVRESVDYLSRIVGSVSNEQILDVIFKDFCIGK